MKMKNIFLIGLILFSANTFAQEGTETPVNNENRVKIAQNIDALKIAYITRELNLSPEEAQKFWPVYNNYTNELKKAKNELKQDEVSFEEKKVGIMKKYKEEFKKLLNNDSRVNKCFKAEPEFHKLLKAEWMRRRGLQPQNRQQGGKQLMQPGKGDNDKQRPQRNEHSPAQGGSHNRGERPHIN